MEKIKKYPNLHKYYNSYLQREGRPEHEHCFPNLLIWFRCVIDNDDELAMNILEMDDDERDEFCSWGHNSRWNHVAAPIFDSLMATAPEELRDMLVDLAEQNGQDPDIEKMYFSKKDDKNDK